MLTPDLIKPFIRTHSLVPAEAEEGWDAYTLKRDVPCKSAQVRRLLQIVSGEDRSTIQHFVSPTEAAQNCRPSLRVTEYLHWILDELSRLPLDPEDKVNIASIQQKSYRPSRIGHTRDVREGPVLLFFPSPVPSDYFYLTVINQITKSLSSHSVQTVVVPVDPTAFSLVVKTSVFRYNGSAVLLLRLPPPEDLLAFFEHWINRKLVLLHCDEKSYTNPPVAAHIRPNHTPLMRDELCRWLRTRNLPLHTGDEVVLVAMPDESLNSSLRTIRKSEIRKAITSCNLSLVEEVIPDYSFDRGFAVAERYTAAKAFVCLADTVAVAVAKGVEQRLLQEGKTRDQAKRIASDTVLGFDASPLASRAGITSFDQGIEYIGRQCLCALLGGEPIEMSYPVKLSPLKP